jgi:pimeloyl-ACP methyl ester carboxylesterase
VQRQSVEFDGERVHYVDFGDPGVAAATPPLVLVHGLGGSHVNWFAVAPRLAERRRVYAIDLPGFGFSPRSPAGASLGALARSVGRFVDHVSRGPVDVIGNSMGGAVSLLLAARSPSRVRRAVLVCPALPPPRRPPTNPRFLAMFLLAAAPFGHLLFGARARRSTPEALVAETLTLCCVDPSRVPREVVAEQIALARTRSARPWTDLAFSEAARSIAALLARPGAFYRTMDRVASPALVVHGARDRVVDVRAAEALCARCPHFDLEIMSDVGHVPQLEAPERFVDTVVPWLDRAGRSASGSA